MYRIILLFLLTQINGFDSAYKKIELNRVAEVNFSRNLGESNNAGKMDTGLVVSSDDKYLYLITIYYSATDIVTFSWATEKEEITDEIPKKGNIQIKGQLLYDSVGEGLMLWKLPRPENFKPELCKFTYPIKDNKLYCAIKNFDISNKINLYSIKEKALLNDKYYTNSSEHFYVKEFKISPRGGGIIFNDKGEIAGIIKVFMPDLNAVQVIPGTVIEKFIKNYQEKDDVPKAPVEDLCYYKILKNEN